MERSHDKSVVSIRSCEDCGCFESRRGRFGDSLRDGSHIAGRATAYT